MKRPFLGGPTNAVRPKAKFGTTSRTSGDAALRFDVSKKRQRWMEDRISDATNDACSSVMQQTDATNIKVIGKVATHIRKVSDARN